MALSLHVTTLSALPHVLWICLSQHAGRVGGQAGPIVEIKEWLDTSGRKTSVDLVDLGKARQFKHQPKMGPTLRV